MLKIDGKKTILDLNQKVSHKNKEAWRLGREALQERIRGNCWVVFKRLVYDYRNHFGNMERAEKKQLPFVDSDGWLHTSPALIAFMEGKSMGNRTVSRWLDALQHDKAKMIDGKPFIVGFRLISKDACQLKLNEEFFFFREGDLPPEKPPDSPDGHIELSKLAKRFNRKYHNK